MTPKKEETQKLAETKKIAYTITDKYFPDFDVLESPNAWWIDKGKVERLISAFKIDASIMESCVYAGITYEQYKYFVSIHPHFSLVKEACCELPVLQARQEVVKGLPNDKEFCLKYLERKRKNEFSVKQYTETQSEVNVKHELSTPMMQLLQKAGALIEPSQEE